MQSETLFIGKHGELDRYAVTISGVPYHTRIAEVAAIIHTSISSAGYYCDITHMHDYRYASGQIFMDVLIGGGDDAQAGG